MVLGMEIWSNLQPEKQNSGIDFKTFEKIKRRQSSEFRKASGPIIWTVEGMMNDLREPHRTKAFILIDLIWGWRAHESSWRVDSENASDPIVRRIALWKQFTSLLLLKGLKTMRSRIVVSWHLFCLDLIQSLREWVKVHFKGVSSYKPLNILLPSSLSLTVMVKAQTTKRTSKIYGIEEINHRHGLN